MLISKSHARGQYNYYIRERTPAALTQLRRPAPNELAPAPFGVIFCLKIAFFSFDFSSFKMFCSLKPTRVYCNRCLVVLVVSRDGEQESRPSHFFFQLRSLLILSSLRLGMIRSSFFSLCSFDQLLNIDIEATVCVLISLFTKCTSPQWIP